MRIAYISAGAGGMYCGSCLHDNTLAAALLERGEEVVLVPTYTPLRTDEEDVSEPRVFFGGINVYLQQRFPLFRRTPAWLDRWLDWPWLLNWAASRGVSIDPSDLGDMTVSMLRGEEGNQRKELHKLADWLRTDVQPDVVHLSNSMLLGLAPLVASEFGPPIVCSLSGEDIFLEKLGPPHYQEARGLLQQQAEHVDAFVAMNRYYAEYMAEYLAVDRAKVHVIRHGLNLAGHGQRDSNDGAPPVSGYLALICADKGLHLLVEACELLAADATLPLFHLHVAGYLPANGRSYLRDLERRIERGRLGGRYRFHGELNRAEKIRFLQSLAIFSTPTVYRESKGLPALEALANGVPVVLPEHGSFPEIIAETGGGLLCRPHDARDLAEKLGELLTNPALGPEMGRRGRQAVHEVFTAQRMAEETLDLYQRLCGKHSSL